MYLLKFLNRLYNTENLWVLFFFVLNQSYSQQVSVQDENTSESLPDVVIYNEDKSKSIITNSNGSVDLGIFSNDEKIYFQLLGYSLLEISKENIVDGGIIFLQEESQALGYLVGIAIF